MRFVIANLKHWLIMSFAFLCLIAGLATVWLPIPTGVPLLALGSFLVIANSRVGRSYVRALRKHVSWLDWSALWLEERTGRSFGRVLKTTRPLVTRHRENANRRSNDSAGQPPALEPVKSASQATDDETA